MKGYLETLRTTAWRTAGSRYNAARRLKQREMFSTFSLAALSALTIAVAFAQRIYLPQPGTPLDNYLTAISAGLGVFLLVLSLLEWGSGLGTRADALHRNAEELTSFQLKLAKVLAQIDTGRVLTDEQVDELLRQYEEIKARCAHNHMPVDHELFKVQHRTAKEFARSDGSAALDRWDACLIRARWNFSTVWFLTLIWVAVIASLALVFLLPTR